VGNAGGPDAQPGAQRNATVQIIRFIGETGQFFRGMVFEKPYEF